MSCQCRDLVLLRLMGDAGPGRGKVTGLGLHSWVVDIA